MYRIVSFYRLRLVHVSFTYRSRFVHVSFSYRSRIVLVSFTYRSRIVSFSYRSRIVHVSFTNRSRIVHVSFSFSYRSYRSFRSPLGWSQDVPFARTPDGGPSRRGCEQPFHALTAAEPCNPTSEPSLCANLLDSALRCDAHAAGRDLLWPLPPTHRLSSWAEL